MSKHISSSKAVTIVVPCYNVEQYLERCIESILGQTHKEIEVVMVDDRSTDNTKKIIQKYENKYANIRAIYNKRNMKQGYGRNIAIESVKTDYVAFVDSDDWLEPTFIEDLFGALLHDKADIAACDIFVKHDNPAFDFRVKMYDPKPNRFGLINTGLAASSSNKLFKTKILKEFKYPENIINEDVSVVLPALYKHKTTYTDKTYYNYYQRPGSTQNGQVTSKRFDMFKAAEIAKERMGSKVDEKIWDAIVWHQIIIVFLVVLPKAQGIFNRRKLIKEFCHIAKEQKIDIRSNAGFANYIKQGTLTRLYGNGIKFFLKFRLYLLCSLYMKVYSTYLSHRTGVKSFIKLLRLPIILVKNPIGFFNKLKSIIVRKKVIKPNLDINSLVIEARRQNKLQEGNLVSVVIPNYNYENFLIQRVYSILHQTKKIGEILILDDNSTDGSVKLAEEIKKAVGKYVPIKLINNSQNQGTFRQWNRGFEDAKYDYVWIAEADDYSHKNFLSYAIKPMVSNENVVISYVDTGFVDGNGLFIESARRHIDYQKSGHWNRDYITSGLEEVKTYSFLNNTIANVSSVIFKKRKGLDYEDIFAESRNYKQAGDWVFYVNYMLQGDIAYVNKTFNYYRMHGSNVSAATKAKNHLNEILKVYKMLDNKVELTKKHKQMQAERIKFLKKAWNV